MRRISVTANLTQAEAAGVEKFRKQFSSGLAADVPTISRAAALALLIRRALVAEGVEISESAAALDPATGAEIKKEP
jgi:hypothetical protein